MSGTTDKNRGDAAGSGPTHEDLIALAEAVREASRPEPPRSVDVESSWICFELTQELFDQLKAWRIRAARQLNWDDVTDVEVLTVLLRILATDEELTARVIATLRKESTS